MVFKSRTTMAVGLFQAVLPVPFGAIGVRVQDDLLKELTYLPRQTEAITPKDVLAKEVVRQIRAYLKNPDHRFDLPMASCGSGFQQRVWGAIRTIPRGQVRSYGSLARTIKSAPRAVGQACGANWFPLIIPCHRVISQTGLGGFGGTAFTQEANFHLQVKRWLLAHEGANDERLLA